MLEEVPLKLVKREELLYKRKPNNNQTAAAAITANKNNNKKHLHPQTLPVMEVWFVDASKNAWET